MILGMLNINVKAVISKIFWTSGKKKQNWLNLETLILYVC